MEIASELWAIHIKLARMSLQETQQNLITFQNKIIFSEIKYHDWQKHYTACYIR